MPGCDVVLGLEENSAPTGMDASIDAVSRDGMSNIDCPSDDFAGTTITNVWGMRVSNGGVGIRQDERLVFDVPNISTNGAGGLLAAANRIASIGRVEIELLAGPTIPNLSAALLVEPMIGTAYRFEVTNMRATVRIGPSNFVVANYAGEPIILSVVRQGTDLVFSAGGGQQTIAGAGTIADVTIGLGIGVTGTLASTTAIEWDNLQSVCP